ncbi:MAG: 4Fe-4S binding protein [Desulfomonilaceae bacterium]|nr:4Fe-4S binding protein [Desulfomonilaceae bacterium]
MPVIKEEDCTRCRACANICPKAVFDAKNGEVTVCSPAYCTGCESCTAVCPKAAVTLKQL